jgi:hypothetical protein
MLDIQTDQIAELKQLSDAGQYAEAVLTTDTLRQEFDDGVIRRKSFCDGLGYGESTLSTWLQAGHIPRVAAVAYVLWLAVKKLGKELQLRDGSSAEPYVIRCGDGYAVVQPADHGPEPIGRVIASSIETVELAQEIATARSRGFRKVLDRAITALHEYGEQYDEHDNWVAELAGDLERARDFKVGPVSAAEL